MVRYCSQSCYHVGMSKKYDIGTKVEWDWGNGTASGEIDEIYTERVEKTLKGSEVVREGSEDDPAYLSSARSIGCEFLGYFSRS